MQVQVIIGDSRDGSTNMLRHLMELQDWINEPAKTVYVDTYGVNGLLEILKIRVALEWQPATDHVIELEELVLHLVRRTNSPVIEGRY